MSDVISPPPRTSELVVARMHELIDEGVWPVGARIPPEPALVTQFGVGRNTIREAVRALEHQGLLAPRRGDGTYVVSRNVLTGALERCAGRTELLDLIAVRRALEAEAAAAAALQATEAQRRQVRADLDAAEAALATEDVADYARRDIAFHRSLVEASGNRLLIDMYEALAEVMQRAHGTLVESMMSDGVHPKGHADVVVAIEAGDPVAARAAVLSYLDVARNAVR